MTKIFNAKLENGIVKGLADVKLVYEGTLLKIPGAWEWRIHNWKTNKHVKVKLENNQLIVSNYKISLKTK